MAFAKHHLFPTEDQHTSALAFALSHPARLHILRMLEEGPRYVGEIVRNLPLGQPAVSDHLKVLRRVGLIGVNEEGRWNEYFLSAVVVEDLVNRVIQVGVELGVSRIEEKES